MIHCIIIEDDNDTLELLIKEMSMYKEIFIVGTANSIKEANLLLHKITPNLCITDIKLRDGEIFSVFSNLEKIPFNIVFITAYEDYAIKAIKFSALDYILKPIELDEFHKLIRNYIKQKFLKNDYRIKHLQNTFNGNTKLEKIIIPTKEQYEIFNINDIEFCESEGAYTFFYLKDGTKILSCKPIGFFEELLSEYRFFRIHQQYLININYVKSIFKGNPLFVKLLSGVVLPVSRLRKSDFLNFYLH